MTPAETATFARRQVQNLARKIISFVGQMSDEDVFKYVVERQEIRAETTDGGLGLRLRLESPEDKVTKEE